MASRHTTKRIGSLAAAASLIAALGWAIFTFFQWLSGAL